MENNEKIIKEMAKDLCVDCGFPTCTPCKVCDSWEYAENAINAGYRKIPEGAVILSRVEYNDYLNLKDLLDKGYFTSENRDAIHKARKETAREIMKLVDNKLDLYRNGVIGRSLYDDGYKSAVQEIKQSVAKQFGVEIEE